MLRIEERVSYVISKTEKSGGSVKWNHGVGR